MLTKALEDRITTNFVYNKELDVASIWRIVAINRTNCSANSLDYNAIRVASNFWNIGLETRSYLTFLTKFWSKILICNLEYEWGNVRSSY